MTEKKIKITETVLRDAHQSLVATRMGTEDMLPILEKMDQVGFYSLECWGGATFDSCIRFLNEDPWQRLRKLHAALPNTPIMMLLRGQNLLGYRHYADDVVDKFVEAAARNGIGVFRIYATLKFSPKTQDGKFIGRSQEAYDKFVEFIKLTNEQAKTGKELSETVYLPFVFDSAKIEIQGTNPDHIKAVDIATILYKAFINLTIENFEALADDSVIDPSNIIVDSDDVCTVKFKTENSVYLTPIFTNTSMK